MKFDKTSWILGIILGLLLMDISYVGSKRILQGLITKNYHARERHELSDRMYWADWIYFKYYGGDYSFYKGLY